MRQISVLLVQLPVPNNPATNVPLAAGYLKAYAGARGLLDRARIDILPRAVADRAGDAALVEAIVARRPDVLGLSLYTWNSERTLDVARRAKERLPDMLVVAGGPEVQRDNDWLLRHPTLDIGVIGEGEQTFAELLAVLYARQAPSTNSQEPSEAGRRPDGSWFSVLGSLPGLAFRDPGGLVVFTAERVPLPDLAVVPSPYLLGELEIEPGAMLMVEVSRWCPYACSFCLYGRNMGAKLGGRLFGLERVLAEIRWGLERGATRVHFIEANLNLVPIFQPLMRALADLNADGRLALYAELRGEHLGDAAVESLARAGLRVAEVGLQTANPAALRASHRRTDLQKWAAGARRLQASGVEVLLDVILGLPEDDEAGVQETLDFIGREQLGPYDVFTLQALPGVELRRQAADYGVVYQDRPPYYVLATDRLPYERMRALRRELKQGAGLDPDAVDGCPQPRQDALADRAPSRSGVLIAWLRASDLRGCDPRLLAAHVDLVARAADLPTLAELLPPLIAANPTTLLDIYLVCATPPAPDELCAWRAALPYQPGYLDRVAVYGRATPEPPHRRVSPRLFLVLPWDQPADPSAYAGVAELVWEYWLGEGEEPPLAAWAAAGGAGVLVRGAPAAAVEQWRAETGLSLWHT